MNLSVFVFDSVQAVDIVVHLEQTFPPVPEFTHVKVVNMFMRAVDEAPVDNNSPPFVETLGVAVGEVIDTREALA